MDEDPSATDADTERRYREMARNPLLPRSQVEDLVVEFDRLLAIAAPPEGFPELSMSETSRTATCARRGLVQGLADRDAGDRAEPRREQLAERVMAALTTVTDCIDGMQSLESDKLDAEATATADGFIVQAGGGVAIGADTQGSPEGQAGARARHERRIVSTVAEMDRLQLRTVDAIREQLDVGETGIPWTLMECARAGLDLSGSFEASAQLPHSPLRDLMERLAAEMHRANAAARGESR
ncbi:hypothetical protein [Mycobacterium aquaticum]|uniref:Uncharacterized protein n=1 Tax=Mycobacterium aquaticum TaxID=1927124 RepID=A0A1X0B752_9MYCO|nr:hypothetical protein [Mycobacterium aquaticum]ORA38167.1 hypothetical protein BST13_06125 [Mycobacterium aquaticum]